jgi:S-adenosylmethionine hydrolase
MRCITLTTDFGTRDWFVGTLKGAILGIHPRCRVVDLTHEITPGDIRAAAFALAASRRYFPKGTIHVVVVDPGVGSRRSPIAVQTARGFFVGPDNGVLSLALAQETVKGIHRLENPRYFLTPVSRTFHGRDIFAPAAAHLSRGLSIRRFGPEQGDFVRLPWPTPQAGRRAIVGEVVYVDHFGNAITNIASSSLRGRTCAVYSGAKRLAPVNDFYQSVAAGQPVAVPGSSGYLEVAVNRGSAAARLRLRVGTAVAVRW